LQAVYSVAKRLIDRARAGDGPAFLLCNTYRYTGHHVGDINREYYRSKQEEEEWKTKRDPIKILAGLLLDEKLADEATLAALADDVRIEMKSAVDFAVAAPYPGPEEVEMHVYA